jgi:CheY-like chemotaxis protein
MTATLSDAGATTQHTILVVDDDPTFGVSLCRVLGDAGYATRLATDFSTALEMLTVEQPPDLLLVDIVMPGGVNGLALSRMARLRLRELKVVYLTGYNIPGVDREALGPILRKPVENAVLIAEIARTLAG